MKPRGLRHVIQSHLFKSYYLGATGFAAFYSLLQDFIGQKKMLELIEHNWVDGIYTVPIAAAVFGWTAIALFKMRRMYEDARNFQ